jgi:uncharacterized membrane protein
MAFPSDPPRSRSSRAATALVGFGLWGILVFLARQRPPDGHEHGNLVQFLGRFHPLLVHAPVALLGLVVLLELTALRPRWSYLRPAARWILALTAAAAFLAAFDGWLLAWGGGLRGRDVTQHMWAGVMLVGVCAAAVWARPYPGRARVFGAAYPVLLALSLGLMFWAGHDGGKISHGDAFLTEKMPERLRGWLGVPAEAAAPTATAAAPGNAARANLRGGPGSVDPANAAFYRLHVAPLFERSCVTCHRPEKHKGGLRMDTFAQLMRGGDDGPVIVPGKPKASEIVRRLQLPPSDDDSMPSDGDKPLTAEEIQMISQWIAAGAKSG